MDAGGDDAAAPGAATDDRSAFCCGNGKNASTAMIAGGGADIQQSKVKMRSVPENYRSRTHFLIVISAILAQ